MSLNFGTSGVNKVETDPETTCPVHLAEPTPMTMAIKNSRTSSSPLERAAAGTPGDPGAFEALFLEHWPRVFGLLRRLVGDDAEAEDLALDAFLRLYRRKPSEDGELNVGGWLHRVATNLGLNAIRGWKRRQRYELESGKMDLSENHPASPDEVYAGAEERQRVRAILAQMEPRQAQVLILRHSGQKYQEIAAALDVSPASIGPLLARAENEFERRYRAADEEKG
jgi:RNA polymerase sigma-70 factor (ECF subfamily)